ncbi:allantoicase [Woeseia oceani]|uniref:Probable allantoicase n=1 Tax=Woeseia oceani TaxID=1548547 RepID=A0A193LIT1_9GAMM|nr:allantoicase [Woeseia oceani]ANO52381.1 allantoicase [Woeseia oceani]
MSKNPFHQWLPLEHPRLGTRVVYANDEFFAAKERLIEPAPPVFIPDKYDDHGKWMDGWETRRKRGPGHDFCVIRLGIPGVIRGVDIDTSHFTGNYPPAASLDACVSTDDVPDDSVKWVPLLPQTPLQGDAHHWHAIDNDNACTHLRLNIFPDGGIARLRIFGEVQPDWTQVADDEVVDLLAVERGGRALAASDEHFGSMHNLNVAGRGINMGDGWETARRRGPGNDWCVLALGHKGIIERVEVDTAHFKGNYPDRVLLQAANVDEASVNVVDLPEVSKSWPSLLAESKLHADRQHFFESELADIGPVSHVRMSIFPDGGVSRLRVYGRIARS